jgi:pyrroloquinoline quinone (PQQ) biosynthesis protein C
MIRGINNNNKPMNPQKVNAVREANEASLSRIKQHPFIRKAHEKSLTKNQSERWILCAGRESRTFPGILENMVNQSSNPGVKAILQENLDDEYGNGNPDHAHFKHYLHLLEKLGIPYSVFESYHEKAGISLAISLAKNISQQPDEALAIGYMLVNEGMTPITYEAARSTLTAHHPRLNTTFFDLHIEVDAEHVAELYNAVTFLPDSDMEALLFGISIGERGMAVLLDEALGIYDHWNPNGCGASRCGCDRGRLESTTAVVA